MHIKYGEMGVFTSYPELNVIFHKVVSNKLFNTLDEHIILQNKWNLKKLYVSHPELFATFYNGKGKKENHEQASAPIGAMGLKPWGSLASKLAAYPMALDPHLWCQACP